MPLNEMAELVTQCCREFGLVFEDRQQAARHEHIPRHGVRVRQRLVEHDEAVGTRKSSGANDPLPDTVDVGLQHGIVVRRSDQPFDLARQRGRAAARRCSACLRRSDLWRAAGNGRQDRDGRQNPAKIHDSSTRRSRRRVDLRRLAKAAAIAARLE